MAPTVPNVEFAARCHDHECCLLIQDAMSGPVEYILGRVSGDLNLF